MKRRIKKVAVIGSGIMGGAIACHFANIGVKVILLDILPKELTENELKKGWSLADKQVRNRIVNDNLAKILKSKPSPIYHQNFANHIKTGNLKDDIAQIKDADWIIEAVIERLEVKKAIFEKIDQYRTSGTLVTSNTSGIPVAFMSEGRSDDFKKHFAITHFFNPPRYLQLFEVIPNVDCKPEVIDFLISYGEKFLGKTPVLAKDTPAFIGNRIGIFGIMHIFHTMKSLGLSVSQVDKLTGIVIGRPKSATFRTADLVGLDTLVHVANGLAQNCPNDEAKNTFILPDFIQKMMENQYLGEKTKQGFYKKTASDDGKSEILELNLDTMEYETPKKVSFPTLEITKSIENVLERLPILIKGTDKAGEFYRKTFAALFAYVQNRIPEISDELYRIDDAMKAGFGWQNGPFEIWEAIGVQEGVALMQSEGYQPALWVTEMLASGNESFHKLKDGLSYYYDVSAKKYVKKSEQEGFIILENIRPSKTIWQNAESRILDLGDGILNLEFHSKMNTIGGGVLQGINKTIDLAEKYYEGLVVGNQGANFSVGANIETILMMATEQKYDELYMTIKYFQDTMMRMRYSSVPTVAAPHGMTLGGGCELCLHADKVVAAAETYIGLVELGVGVIPGGGGTKELTMRASDSLRKNDVALNRLQEYFLTIAMAKVSTSAYEAFDWDILQKGKDVVIMSKIRQIAEAKKQALLLAEAGYTQPLQRSDIKVFGRQLLATLLVGTDSMREGNYISEYDKKIADKLAYVMAGGDLSEPTFVSEQYLLELEREAFLSLCTERKTLERIEYMLQNGKPLRN
ncbi:3-hydroxyacyl-CoA dehydrogenase NAD-binding domain-containing protein [Capnocytophaga sp.]|uniref:3-hydroxyacyl-CoA dehydrogenase NAD-binding domain-containing protein n=1 Tax=Capnocytophaga sp. TaxID=44737 RepID=UPI0026DAB880|nr:3-hydroxyacyl-CoA dehydrogenase NAD-binding domain-containing protein [Capnocytophaga sp.]MDO5105147.1 3-hydroxyacyl-CoA dehydrogenase NAD-binding domain-containing protein [Capnocytophaga sp.]